MRNNIYTTASLETLYVYYLLLHEYRLSLIEKCEWTRSFDSHFNISCVGETGQRANGNFKPDKKVLVTTWDFKFCPYCGREIELDKQSGSTNN